MNRRFLWLLFVSGILTGSLAYLSVGNYGGALVWLLNAVVAYHQLRPESSEEEPS